MYNGFRNSNRKILKGYNMPSKNKKEKKDRSENDILKDVQTLFENLKSYQDFSKSLVLNSFHYKNQKYDVYGLDNPHNHFFTSEKLPTSYLDTSNLYEYLAIKIKEYFFQRLLNQLLIWYEKDSDKICLKVHLTYATNGYNSTVTDPLNKREANFDLETISTRGQIKRAKPKYENSYNLKYNFIKKTEPFLSLEDSFRYTLFTPFDRYRFLKTDPTLLHWQIDNRKSKVENLKITIPDIYNDYLSSLLYYLDILDDKNIFSKAFESLDVNEKLENNVKTKKANKNLNNIIDTYNSLITLDSENLIDYKSLKVSIGRDTMSYRDKELYIHSVHYNYFFLLNNIIANDFFKSIDSDFFFNIVKNISFSELYKLENTYDIELGYSLINILELLATFNIDTHKIDVHINHLISEEETSFNESISFSKTYANPFLAQISNNCLITDRIVEFIQDLHFFLLSAINSVIDSCQYFFKTVVDLQNELIKNKCNQDITLPFIKLIGNVLSSYVKSDSLFYTIPYNEKVKDKFGPNEKLCILYLFHYLSIHRDLHDRLVRHEAFKDKK